MSASAHVTEVSARARAARSREHVGVDSGAHVCTRPRVRHASANNNLTSSPIALQNPRRLFLWQMLIVNASQTWALYCLVLFYHELHRSLHALKPFGKFIAIKCVIFLSFWQAVVISLLAYSGAIHETHGSLGTCL